MTGYLTVMVTAFSWLMYTGLVYCLAAAFTQRQRKQRGSARKLGLWLMLWAVFAGGLLVYLSVNPVGIAGMVWIGVNIGLMLPVLDERENDASQASRKLASAAISMTLLSALLLVVGWPLAVLYPETEPHKFITVLIAGIASVMFVLAIVSAWRRWHSHKEQSS